MLREPFRHDPPPIYAAVERREEKQLQVEIELDALQQMAQAGPRGVVGAAVELIWNGFDASATRVVVEIDRTDIGAMERIRVIDNGDGIRPEVAEVVFQKIGGSKKVAAHRDRLNRRMHGRHGQGRLRSFKIGTTVTWDSVAYLDDGVSKQSTIIRSHFTTLRRPDLKTEPYNGPRLPGTTVTIDGIKPGTTDLSAEQVVERLVEEFALFLTSNPDTTLVVDGRPIDPAQARIGVPIEYEILTEADGKALRAQLRICEWSTIDERKIVLCSDTGHSLWECHPGIQAPGFRFTAYLLSERFVALHESGDLGLHIMHPEVQALVEVAKDRMRRHFDDLREANRRGLVAQWKAENVYPYEGEPEDEIAQAERLVFDVVAHHVQAHLDKDQKPSIPSRRLSFRLMRMAIETGSENLIDVLDTVVTLPPEQIVELRELLQQTTLEAVIRASRSVIDRMNLLKSIDLLVHSDEGRDRVLEKSQLHCIIAENAWLFGEQYAVSSNDADLTTVLERHIREGGREVVDNRPVLDAERRRRRVDLVLGCTMGLGDDRTANLVVELKRPAVVVDLAVVRQIEDYAEMVVKDARYDMDNVSWDFVAISSRISEDLDQFEDRRTGLWHTSKSRRHYRIILRTWGQVIEAARQRMNFFRDRLQVNPSNEDGLQHLKRLYLKYIPEGFEGK